MNTKVNQILESVINIAIISLAVLFGYILVQNFILSSSNNLTSNNSTENGVVPAAAPAGIQTGAKVDVPDVDWKENKKTLVIYSSSGCGFCTASMPFYKELAQKQAQFETKIVVISSESIETSKRYFTENGVNLSEIRQANLVSVGVRGTPTLLLVNDKGEVSNSWVGRLPKERETEVISHL